MARRSTKPRHFALARSEGLRRFYERIIAPMVRGLAVDPTEQEWARAKLAVWFDAPNRDIVSYKALYPFKIIGPAWETASTPLKLRVDGAGDRHVAAGDYIWVRMDARKPTELEVEFKDQVFVVSPLFFDTVMRSKLKEVSDLEALKYANNRSD